MDLQQQPVEVSSAASRDSFKMSIDFVLSVHPSVPLSLSPSSINDAMQWLPVGQQLR